MRRLAFALLSLTFVITDARAESFYVSEGGTLNRVEGDPTKVRASEWQIRLYPLGSPATGPGYTGLIIGPTAESVQRQLQQSQRFAKSWEKFCQCDDPDAHATPLGPIAVVEPQNTLRKGQRQTLEGHATRVGAAIANYLRATEHTAGASPYAGVGLATLEYGSLLVHSMHEFRRLQAELAHGMAAWQDADGRLQRLDQTLQAGTERFSRSSPPSDRFSSRVSRNGLCDGKPMLPGERCCVDADDPDIFMVCVANGACPPMPGMRCDP